MHLLQKQTIILSINDMVKFTFLLCLYLMASCSPLQLIDNNIKQNAIEVVNHAYFNPKLGIKYIYVSNTGCAVIDSENPEISRRCEEVSASQKSSIETDGFDRIIQNANDYQKKLRYPEHCRNDAKTSEVIISLDLDQKIAEFYFLLPVNQSLFKTWSCGAVQSDIRIYLNLETNDLTATHGILESIYTKEYLKVINEIKSRRKL